MLDMKPNCMKPLSFSALRRPLAPAPTFAITQSRERAFQVGSTNTSAHIKTFKLLAFVTILDMTATVLHIGISCNCCMKWSLVSQRTGMKHRKVRALREMCYLDNPKNIMTVL